MEGTRTVEFTLAPGTPEAVAVRMRRVRERWMAEVHGSSSMVAVGATARAALSAALKPLGDAAACRLLADLGLLGPSLAVISMEEAARAG